jgi:hypothetical protein
MVTLLYIDGSETAFVSRVTSYPFWGEASRREIPLSPPGEREIVKCGT